MRSPFALITLLTFAAAPTLLASPQSAMAPLSEVQPGSRVRVVAPGILAGRYVATVITRTSDSLVLSAPNAVPLRIPLAGITSIEISRGSSRFLGAQRGLVIGVPIGLAGGLLLAAATPECRSCLGARVDRVALVASSVLAGAFYGAGIGALVGRERWEPFAGSWHAAWQLREGQPSLALSLRL